MSNEAHIEALLEKVARLWIEDNGYDGYVAGYGSVMVPYVSMAEQTYYKLHRELFPKAWMGWDISNPKEAARLDRYLEMESLLGESPSDGTHTVYCHWGEDDEPLYVGKSSHLKTRQAQHRETARWWPEIKRISFVIMEDEAKMDTEEKLMIRTLHPKYNVVHNNG
jgi:hypothetical protein